MFPAVDFTDLSSVVKCLLTVANNNPESAHNIPATSALVVHCPPSLPLGRTSK